MCSSIEKYLDRIVDDIDRPLFEEAVKVASVGASRSAYLMIWLSCAEALKRRFREAAKRDNAAGKIIGEIEEKEVHQKAVDKYILDKAKDYGLISEFGHHELMHVYSSRCIFGHPYEEAPTEEQLLHAAAMVIDFVLSQPLKLRQGYGRQVISSLIGEINFLDDQEEVVLQYADTTLFRIDESLYPWLMHSYWEELEKIANDPTFGICFRRGVSFSYAILARSTCEIFSAEEWHTMAITYPSISIAVLADERYFDGVGDLTRDFLVSELLTRGDHDPIFLNQLQKLDHADMLTDRQQERLHTFIAQPSYSNITQGNITLVFNYPKTIDDLKSHDWYKQNPAVNYIRLQGTSQVGLLKRNQQVELGRNILQAAEGNANSAVGFIAGFTSQKTQWPIGLIQGMLLECFTNERQEFRLKVYVIDFLLRYIDTIAVPVQRRLVKKVVESIQASKLKTPFFLREQIDKALLKLEPFPWANDICDSLISIRADLIDDEWSQ
ncbi:MAG: hypothetical protein WCJ56_02160 [bacterium]